MRRSMVARVLVDTGVRDPLELYPATSGTATDDSSGQPVFRGAGRAPCDREPLTCSSDVAAMAWLLSAALRLFRSPSGSTRRGCGQGVGGRFVGGEGCKPFPRRSGATETTRREVRRRSAPRHGQQYRSACLATSRTPLKPRGVRTACALCTAKSGPRSEMGLGRSESRSSRSFCPSAMHTDAEKRTGSTRSSSVNYDVSAPRETHQKTAGKSNKMNDNKKPVHLRRLGRCCRQKTTAARHGHPPPSPPGLPAAPPSGPCSVHGGATAIAALSLGRPAECESHTR